MNIWAWVEATQEELRRNGRSRLADLMDLVPHYMSDNLHEKLDSVVPEALALAREAKNPWVEVFLRHWNLQSRILQRYQVKEFLSEAVNLIDFANREDTKDCPQSVCTTQDLANCYAHLDGPAYSNERLEVAHETLSRITPEWPCFTCISGEYATALLDAGRAEDALQFIEKQKADLVRIGRADRKDEMVGTQIDALIALGRLDDALEMNRRAKGLGRGESFMEFRRLDEARILSRLGQHAEAKRHLPAFDEVARTPSQYEPWAEAVLHLAEAGAIENDFSLHAKLEDLVDKMRANGAVRRAIQLALWQARLAILRSRPFTASRSAETIRALIPALRAPLGAPDLLADLEARIAELEARLGPPEPVGETPDEVVKALGKDPEIDLFRTHRASLLWPEHEPLTVASADALFALGDRTGAIARLEQHLAKSPDSPDVVLRLLHMLRIAKKRRELDAFAERTLERSEHPEVRASCLWALALDADDRGEKRAAKALLERILAIKPEAVNTRLLLARIERELGDLEAACDHLDRLVSNNEPGTWDWDRMVAATLLGRWDAVRDSARRVGMTIEGSGPIDADGELVRIEFQDEESERLLYHAVRTGPVTARIVEIAHPAHLQHYGDRVVFDAHPKNAGPAEGEEHHTYIYASIAVVSAGDYRSYVLDGVHPGDDLLKALRTDLLEMGCRLEQRSDQSYMVHDSESGAQSAGLYAFVAVPGSVDLARVHALLSERARTFPGPLVWEQLARSAGDVAAARAHDAIAEQMGLY